MSKQVCVLCAHQCWYFFQLFAKPHCIFPDWIYYFFVHSTDTAMVLVLRLIHFKLRGVQIKISFASRAFPCVCVCVCVEYQRKLKKRRIETIHEARAFSRFPPKILTEDNYGDKIVGKRLTKVASNCVDKHTQNDKVFVLQLYLRTRNIPHLYRIHNNFICK